MAARRDNGGKRRGGGGPSARLPIPLLALFLCLISAFLPGCGGNFQDHRTVLTFSFWGNYKDLEFFKAVAAGFEETHPDTRIELRYTPNEYGEKLQLQLMSNSAADLILMDDEPFPSYSVRGYLEDLRPFIARDGVPVDAFWPTALDAFTYNGEIGALCWTGVPTMMFYNKDLFDAAGEPYPPDDWTWEDFRRIAKTLTRDTNGDGHPDQWGAQMVLGWLDSQPLFWSYGADFLNPERTAASADTPEALAAIQFLRNMRVNDGSTIGWADQQGQNRETQILTGRVAMTYGGWFLAQLLGGVKDGMRWGACHLPRGPSGRRHTRVTWDGISINRHRQDMENPNLPEARRVEIARRKELAWLFVKHMVSEDVQALAAKMGRGIPITREWAERHFVDPESEADEHLALETFSFGKLTPVTDRFYALRRVIDLNMGYLEREDISLRRTPEEVVAGLQRDINTVLARGREELETGRRRAAARDPRLYRVAGALLLLALAAGAAALARRTSHAVEDFRALARSSRRRREAFWGVLFASPWLLGFCLFLAFPILFSLVLSFSYWDPYEPVNSRVFVGMDNYVRAFTADPMVWFSLRKSLTYAFVAVPVTLACALGLAMLLNQKVRGVGVFRTIFYIPNVVGGVATAIMWNYLFNPVFGPVNGFIRALNRGLAALSPDLAQLPLPGWLNDPRWAMPSMFLMMLWATGGGAMIIFLAGLQGVPAQLYEAAELDGAGHWRKFWNVTLPMLTPTIYFNLIMGMIGALQVFMQAFVLMGKDGGWENQLLFFVLYLYRKGFLDYEFGYAAALAWMLFAIILALTLLVVRTSRSWVYYEGENR